MPITFRIEKDRDLTVFKVTGVLNFDEAMATVKSFYEAEPTKNVIWDLQEVTEIPFSSKEVESIADNPARAKGKRPGGKTAFVSQNNMVFGLARMFQIQTELKNIPYTVKVFRTIKEANDWLDES